MGKCYRDSDRCDWPACECVSIRKALRHRCIYTASGECRNGDGCPTGCVAQPPSPAAPAARRAVVPAVNRALARCGMFTRVTERDLAEMLR